MRGLIALESFDFRVLSITYERTGQGEPAGRRNLGAAGGDVFPLQFEPLFDAHPKVTLWPGPCPQLLMASIECRGNAQDSDVAAIPRSLQLLEFHREEVRRVGACTPATWFADPRAVGCA